MSAHPAQAPANPRALLLSAKARLIAMADSGCLGLGWQFHGQLKGVPNLQSDGFSLLRPVRIAGQVEGVVLVRSEENGLSVHPSETLVLWSMAACSEVHFHQTFLRADEWLGDRPLWTSLAQTQQLLRDGLGHIQHP